MESLRLGIYLEDANYDGWTFKVADQIEVVFEKEWMEKFSVLVDCVYTALGNGGLVEDAGV